MSDDASKALVVSTDLDRQLQKFLQEANQDRAKGFTLANIVLKLNALTNAIAELRSEVESIRSRVARHGREIKELKLLAKYEGEPDTGQHNVDDLKREVERVRAEREAERHQKEADGVWWKRQIVVWVVAAVGAIALMLGSVIVTLAISHAR